MKKHLSILLSLVLVVVGIIPCLSNISVKAENPNLITDGDFESYAVNTELTSGAFHWVSGNGINKLSWVDIKDNGWTMSAYGKASVIDVSSIGGSKALQLNSPDHVTYKVVRVEPNTLYEFTYDYYQVKQAISNPSAYGVIGFADDVTRLPILNSNKVYISGGGTGIGTSETDTYPAVSNITLTEVTNVLGENGVVNNWTKAKLRFNSGIFTHVALPFYASNSSKELVVVDNLTLRVVPTASVTTNTVGAGGIGGVASVTPNNQPLEDGLALTYKATVTHDYSTFLGWFKPGESTPYKTDLTFTENYNSATYEVLEARFSSTVKNMINDSNFENYAVGHNLQGDATNRWDGEGIKGNYATPGESGWISAGNWMKMFVTDEKAVSGTKSFSLQGGNSVGKVVKVEGNKNYTLSFKYYAPSGNKISHVGVRDLTGVTEFPFENSYYGNDTKFTSFYQYTHAASVVNDEWTTVSIDIATNSTTEQIGIFFAGNTIAADTFIYYDDIYLIEKGSAANFSQINNQYKTQGRTVYKDGMPSLFYTASAFEFSANFAGDAIVNFQVDSLKDAFGEEHYLTVYVDGVRNPERLVIDKAGSVNVTVAEDLEAGDHTISIYRASENYQGKMYVRGVILPEGATALAAPANKDKYIEVIGDSITSGWGIVPYSGSETATSLREDGTKTYAFLTKEALDTDISVISQSGIGIACHANGNTDDTMDMVYPVVNYSHGYKDTYNHARQPDIVIINIGTNDNYALTHGTMTTTEVKEKFKNFLYYVREKNPAANIIWVYGMMLSAQSEMNTVIQNAIEEVGGEACKFYSIGMTGNQSAHAGHPDAAAHVAASEALVNFINEKNLLASTPAVEPEKPDDDEIEDDTDNLIDDGTFEDYAVGTGVNAGAYHYISGNGVNKLTWVDIKDNGWTMSAYGSGVVVDASPYGGTKALQLNSPDHVTYKVVKVEPNTLYEFTYSYYQTKLALSNPSAYGVIGFADDVTRLPILNANKVYISAGGTGIGESETDPYPAVTNITTTEITNVLGEHGKLNTWTTVKLQFNSGEFSTVALPFYASNAKVDGAYQTVLVDNLSLKAVPKEVITDGSFENTTAQPGGTLDNNKQIWATGANYTSPTQVMNAADFVGGVYAGGWVVKENTTYAFTANSQNENPTTPETPYGENMLMIRNRWQALCKVANVKNNKDYILTYYYYATVENHNLNVSQPKLIGIEDVSTIYAQNAAGGPDSYVNTNVEGQVAIEGYYSDTAAFGRWVKRTVIFNSGNSEKVLIPFDHQNGLMFIDNIELKEMVPVEITYDLKESARIEIIDGIEDAPVADGSIFTFKVIAAKEIVSVTQNGTLVTPDANGIYSFTVDGNTTIAVKVTGDENLPAAGKTADGKDLTKYDTALYTADISKGDTVYHEVALNYVGRNEIQLLYPISEIISVRNYGLDKHYVLGVDYEITADGKLKILENGGIPQYQNAPIKDITSSSSDWEKSWPVSETQHISTWGDDVIPAYGIAVTYKHTTTWNGGFKGFTQKDQTAKMPTTYQKLQNGNDVNIVFFGDSVTVGWSSSGLNQTVYNADNSTTKVDSLNVKPYASTWANMFVENLKGRYPSANIDAYNLALSGKDSAWGKNNIVARLGLLSETPDLVVIAFGLNDSLDNYTSVSAYKANIESIITNVRAVCGDDTEILLVSPFLPNINCSRFSVDTFTGYENALLEIAATDSLVGVATVTSYFKEIVKSKNVSDYLSQNINHGNDFANRIYAQTLIAATTYVEPAAYIPGDINGDGEVTSKDLTALRRYLADWDIEVNEAALDVNADNEVSGKDATYLARYLADWNGYEEIPSVVPPAVVKTSITPEATVSGTDLEVNLSLKDAAKLNGVVSGYELTLKYDATKVEYNSISLPANFLGDANVVANGELKIVCYSSSSINTDMLLNCVKFTVKDGASGTAEFTLTVDEITNNEGVPFDSNLYEGGTVGIVL